MDGTARSNNVEPTREREKEKAKDPRKGNRFFSAYGDVS
jgi:hypothetical protein